MNHSFVKAVLGTVLTIALMGGGTAVAQVPPGQGGIPHRWAPALKQAVTTSYEEGARSPVWATVAEGILTEVYYPTVDRAQLGDLEFLVTDGEKYFSEQKRDTVSEVRYLDSGMTIAISGHEKNNRYTFEQRIVTDPATPVVRIHTEFHGSPGLRLFLLFKPTVENTAWANAGNTGPDSLIACHLNSPRALRDGTCDDNSTHVVLVSNTGFGRTAAGYVGFTDGWQDISRNFHITETSTSTGPGNIALTAEMPMGGEGELTYDLALSFGSNRTDALAQAQLSLSTPFDQIQAAFEQGWKDYLAALQKSPIVKSSRFVSESTMVERSVVIIKMHEDKIHRGGIVASLSIPAIPDADNAGDQIQGYHLVWPRDLYHAAMGLLAAGDTKTPVSVLNFLTQNQHGDGSWSQNFQVDGSAYWPGLQLDEAAYPAILAYQLQKHGVHKPTAAELEMVRKSANFIMAHRPEASTPQDRWEEIGGYVPSTIATEIAGLRAAAQLTGDTLAAKTAEDWQSKVEQWTLVHQGPLGENYYMRVSPTGNPDGQEEVYLANGAGSARANEIMDGGFLELVRMGVREANDPRIVNTLKIYDSFREISNVEASSPQMLSYRRYNRDQYGFNHVGGYWPLLAGERGHYAVAARDFESARWELHAMELGALPSGLIPEQTLSPSTNAAPSAAANGVACPLVWAHAEDILLHRSIEDESIFDTP